MHDVKTSYGGHCRRQNKTNLWIHEGWGTPEPHADGPLPALERATHKNLKGVAVSEGQIIKLLPQESANATPTQGDEQWPCSKC